MKILCFMNKFGSEYALSVESHSLRAKPFILYWECKFHHRWVTISREQNAARNKPHSALLAQAFSIQDKSIRFYS